MSIHKFNYNKTFRLENGKRLKGLQIAYHTYGRLNTRKDNVVWVCHALTANSDVFDWWPGLFGERDLFNPQEHFIICANIIGSHYGTTNPLTTNPSTDQPYYLSFPQFSIRDLVAAHELLAQHLGIDKIKVLIGGSLGGQQAMEWAIIHPDRIENLVLLATNAQHSPWGVAFNESQRLAISADRTFYANKPNGGAKGLKVARSIALLSYRTYETYGATQLESSDEKIDDFRASSYQNYQGEKLVKRFNAYSYWFLSKAMDAHNVGRGRDGAEKALQHIRAKTLVIGITSDILFPLDEQKYLAKHIRNAKFAAINSFYGHDGFLIETKQISKEIAAFLKQSYPNRLDRTLQPLI
ncbi:MULTISPECIES: homoserine O-acetyltransferase family protein [Olivibacter]|jgi:homoserine O-acetyltransferase|uniref:Homoserine O-acetyltransferase n=2 Tax=Sphingobacteriaceae TaxID=84566 RepID=F4C721_SPHS2|nr:MULTISPECIES: homoserine O-acetyltransferase [Olivibacter]MCL4639993.1 homoserine O-acetyltransferase [Olivibacter sp. UJ_SKK_5.1]MDM8175234.1 homoserine O-acetyltransferase [Olivibacter sp. 47]MDX3913087.1 homoserine O-acetyltransferase [Pseudosphingobacterium sp.]QEL02002.1 homoserine O-acetyltransferase [Olivibacter sp. LS-1]